MAELLAVAAGVAIVAVGLDRAGLPAPALFAGLAVGLVHALSTRRVLRLPEAGTTAAQGVVGVVVGVAVQPSSLAALGQEWLAVTLITVATLLLSLGAGLVLARWSDLDQRTSALSMISGGAAGVTAMSDELGADTRVVAVLQYVRILVIVLLMPVVVLLLFDGAGGASEGPVETPDAPVLSLVAVTALVAAGTLLGRLCRLPAAPLLGPLLLTAPLAALDVPGTDAVPGAVQAVALALLGASVGVRFTADTVRTVRRVLPVVLVLLVGLLLGNGALGLLLSALTGLSPLDGYLATTPGGAHVVVAVAAGADADTTAVVAVQVLRMLVMLIAAPAVTRLLLRP